MTTADFKRKLTAILSADVEGYSLLMRDDEEATIRTLTTYRKAITNLIQQYRGRLVDATGDNLLSEFTSVVDAVNCAVEIQRELSERNAELPENRRMQFRIGINLGDVVEEGDRIYGDGVNIAARMEGLAEGGGICISGTAYDQVKHKIGLEYEYLGKQEVKNFTEAVRVYRILSFPGAAAHRVIKAKKATRRKWHKATMAIGALLTLVIGAVMFWKFYIGHIPSVEVASVEKMAYPLPDKPSIAVLPFVNMSDDPKQEYFSDGLTEQIISGLSKVPNLFVIARNSSFTYKGKPVKVQKVAEDLGVKYVLEGSVQKTADRIRITAQLIDATKGHHLWSERYDRNMEDLFAIQDDITMGIMKAMRVELRGDQARLWAKHVTTNLAAYEKYLESRTYFLRFTKEDNAQTRHLIKEAIALDSGFAGAYAFLGWTHFFDARFGWTESRAKSIKMAFEYAQKALALDDTFDVTHTLLAAICLVKRQHEKAVAAAKHALTLNPNGAHEYNTLAGVIGCSGRWEESIIYGKKSIRLDPFPPPTSFHWLGRAYFMTGQYDDAILTFKKAIAVSPNYLPAHAFIAASNSLLGNETEANAAAEQVLRINPKFSLESYAKTLPYKNKTDIERYVSALKKTGLK
ncbi:adenylate/guanylate cyclase domain-containing protein [Thermodesulfobacteriota bacterium]